MFQQTGILRRVIRDERLVAYFLASKGLRAEEFSKEEMTHSKTPDFRVFHGQDFAFFCEVKSLSRDDWLDGLLEAVGPGVVVGGGRNDPTYNRVWDHIYKAVKQFDAVNPGLVYPNVLILVNHDRYSGPDDLVPVLEGDLITEDGHRYAIFRHISEGRIKEKKLHVHLYIWIDNFDGTQRDLCLYNPNDQRFLDVLCSYFGHDPELIRAD